MPTVITCTSCSSSLQVPEALAGKAVKCPKCATVFTAPGGDGGDVMPVAPRPPQSSPVGPPAAGSGWQPAAAGAFDFDGRGDDAWRSVQRPDVLPGKTRAMLAMVLLGGCIAVDLGGAAVAGLAYQTFQKPAPRDPFGPRVPGFEDDGLDVMYGLVGVSVLLRVAALLVTGIVFLCWFYKAHDNLRLLAVNGMTYSPGWGVAYFFIPILSLFRPCQTAQEIYRASDPELPLDKPRGWINGPGSAAIGWWWAFWLMMNIAFQIADIPEPDGPGGRGLLTGMMLVHVTAHLLAVPAAALAILMIRQVQSRQLEKYDRIMLGMRGG
jgi:predicted Zn finger-like uncharacterized protein